VATTHSVIRSVDIYSELGNLHPDDDFFLSTWNCVEGRVILGLRAAGFCLPDGLKYLKVVITPNPSEHATVSVDDEEKEVATRLFVSKDAIPKSASEQASLLTNLIATALTRVCTHFGANKGTAEGVMEEISRIGNDFELVMASADNRTHGAYLSFQIRDDEPYKPITVFPNDFEPPPKFHVFLTVHEKASSRSFRRLVMRLQSYDQVQALFNSLRLTKNAVIVSPSSSQYAKELLKEFSNEYRREFTLTEER
jgi:hypothetical protein